MTPTQLLKQKLATAEVSLSDAKAIIQDLRIKAAGLEVDLNTVKSHSLHWQQRSADLETAARRTTAILKEGVARASRESASPAEAALALMTAINRTF
jgi:RNase P/RNase MRP subunit POP5